MRKVFHDIAEKGRVNGRDGRVSSHGDTYGEFVLVHPSGSVLFVIAADGLDTRFDHVSVSVRKENRCPTWEEMCWVKGLFWEPEECVIQYHPPKSEYVNHHPFVLHMWKPLDVDIPRPPTICV